MSLESGRLAKIDRRIFAELDNGHGTQTVRVPVSDAVWSAWRRYCEVMGVSMGEGLASLMLAELESIVTAGGRTAAAVAEQIAHEAEERSRHLDARQDELDARAEALRREEDRLRDREWELRTSRPEPSRVRSSDKVGRNQRCPCGSGRKYKMCHGRPE